MTQPLHFNVISKGNGEYEVVGECWQQKFRRTIRCNGSDPVEFARAREEAERSIVDEVDLLLRAGDV